MHACLKIRYIFFAIRNRVSLNNSFLSGIKMIYLLSITYTLAVTPIKGLAKESIQWVDLALPPVHHIEEGIGQGEGISDNIIRLMMEKINDIDQELLIQPGNKMMLSLATKKNVCNPSFKKTPQREAFLHYSIPSVFMPNHGIAIRKKDIDKFGDPPVSIKKIMQNSKLRLGASIARSYGKKVDDIIKLHKGNMALGFLSFNKDNSYRRLITLLAEGQVDYILGYPLEFSYIEQQLGINDQILFLPIQETKPYSMTYVVCSKTKQGKKFIEKVNSVLMKERPTESYRSFIEKWLDPATIPAYRNDYDRDFLTNTH